VSAGHGALAGQKTWRANLHCSEQRQQPPRADILEWTLRPAMRAAPPRVAIFVGLRPNKVVLQSRQCPFSVRERQAKRRSRAFICVAAARADLLRPNDTVAPGQLHHDPPLHPAPPVVRHPPDHTTPTFETVSTRFSKQTKTPSTRGSAIMPPVS
jgi:hypothetical protein